MTPWCCRTGGDQPQVWLVRSQSHARNYTVTLTRRAISPGKVGRPKRRRREGATACGLSSLYSSLFPARFFSLALLLPAPPDFPSFRSFPVILLSFTSWSEKHRQRKRLSSLYRQPFPGGPHFFRHPLVFFGGMGRAS